MNTLRSIKGSSWHGDANQDNGCFSHLPPHCETLRLTVQFPESDCTFDFVIQIVNCRPQISATANRKETL